MTATDSKLVCYHEYMPQNTQSTAPNSSKFRRYIFRSLEAKSLRARPLATRFADELTDLCSSPAFLFINALVFITWIVVNIGVLPGIEPFDPYPFGFLTMAVSLEAIFLSIFVLVSQNRAAQIATLRDELNLRVNLIAEQEITKLLKMQVELLKKLRLLDKETKDDDELEFMLKDISASSLEQSIIDQLQRADQPLFHAISKREFPEIIQALTGTKKKK